MPGLLTHHMAGRAVLAGLPGDMHRGLKACRGVFNLGAQGPDFFFYYVPGLVCKRSRGVGQDIHRGRFGAFFMHMARQMKELRDPARHQALLAYLSGLLVHYAVDAHAHPYVYAQVHRPGSTRLQESARHRHLETSIDVLLLAQQAGLRPQQVAQWRLLCHTPGQRHTVGQAFSRAIHAVHNRVVRPGEVCNAITHMLLWTRVLQSRRGRRKRWLAKLEDAVLGRGVRLLSGMVHCPHMRRFVDYLNEKRQTWHAPWAPEVSRTESFMDLYTAAVADATRMVQALHGYAAGTTSAAQLQAVVGNRSLQNGMEGGSPCTG